MKIRVGVIFGGESVEHEISIITACQAMKNMDEAVVILSGGQDSTTCLLWAKKKYKKVFAVSFDYNQRHIKELECAKEICDELGVEHRILDMELLNQLAPNSLTRTDIEVDEDILSSSWLPQ